MALEHLRRAHQDAGEVDFEPAVYAAWWCSDESAWAAADEVTSNELHPRNEQADLVRDIFGSPFSPIHASPEWLTWNDGTIQKLAQAIYADRAFDRLPILADALEDAGCDNTDLLAHCRGPGPHVRGCWAVDLVLGKG
jgi:hypothetical protein